MLGFGAIMRIQTRITHVGAAPTVVHLVLDHIQWSAGSGLPGGGFAAGIDGVLVLLGATYVLPTARRSLRRPGLAGCRHPSCSPYRSC